MIWAWVQKIQHKCPLQVGLLAVALLGPLMLYALLLKPTQEHVEKFELRLKTAQTLQTHEKALHKGVVNVPSTWPNGNDWQRLSVLLSEHALVLRPAQDPRFYFFIMTELSGSDCVTIPFKDPLYHEQDPVSMPLLFVNHMPLTPSDIKANQLEARQHLLQACHAGHDNQIAYQMPWPL